MSQNDLCSTTRKQSGMYLIETDFQWSKYAGSDDNNFALCKLTPGTTSMSRNKY